MIVDRGLPQAPSFPDLVTEAGHITEMAGRLMVSFLEGRVLLQGNLHGGNHSCLHSFLSEPLHRSWRARDAYMWEAFDPVALEIELNFVHLRHYWLGFRPTAS
jgi:hypothetical protein